MEIAEKPQKSKPVQSYTVKSGDTLSAIAKQVYGDENAHKRIYNANKDLIGPDPNKIKVGQVLIIPLT